MVIGPQTRLVASNGSSIIINIATSVVLCPHYPLVASNGSSIIINGDASVVIGPKSIGLGINVRRARQVCGALTASANRPLDDGRGCDRTREVMLIAGVESEMGGMSPTGHKRNDPCLNGY